VGTYDLTSKKKEEVWQLSFQCRRGIMITVHIVPQSVFKLLP